MSGRWYEEYKVDVPEGACGAWRIERFEITEQEAAFSRVRAALGRSRELVDAGIYTKLVGPTGLFMSDTPTEISDHLGFIYRAKGRVLIHGLGLGMAAAACLRKPEVTHVTVIEKAQEVIDLVGPWLACVAAGEPLATLRDDVAARLARSEIHAPRLSVLCDDAFTWKPPRGERWDVVWHDVWQDLSPDNLPEMHRLHRRFGRRCGWQESWGRAEAERQR